MDDKVLRPDRGEAIAVIFHDPFREAWRIWGEFQVGSLDLDQLAKIRDADEARAFHDQRGIRADAGQDQCFQVRRRVGREFDANDPPAPAPFDRRAEITNQIFGLLLDLDVAIAKQPECPRSRLLEAREELVEMSPDCIFDGDEALALARQLEETRQGRRDHQQLDHRLSILSPSKVEHQAEPAVGDEREGMRGIDCLRRQHRQNLLAEIVGQPFLRVGGQFLGGDNRQRLLGERFTQQYPFRLLGDHQGIGFRGDGIELLSGGHAIGA